MIATWDSVEDSHLPINETFFTLNGNNYLRGVFCYQPKVLIQNIDAQGNVF